MRSTLVLSVSGRAPGTAVRKEHAAVPVHYLMVIGVHMHTTIPLARTPSTQNSTQVHKATHLETISVHGHKVMRGILVLPSKIDQT